MKRRRRIASLKWDQSNLGLFPDFVVAKEMRTTVSATFQARKRRGIPAYGSDRRKLDRLREIKEFVLSILFDHRVQFRDLLIGATAELGTTPERYLRMVLRELKREGQIRMEDVGWKYCLVEGRKKKW